MVSVLSLPFLFAGDPIASQQSDTERLEELRRMIEKEIRIPYANEPTQCKLIPFGSKPWRPVGLSGLFNLEDG
jgi:hypothetical protein